MRPAIVLRNMRYSKLEISRRCHFCVMFDALLVQTEEGVNAVIDSTRYDIDGMSEKSVLATYPPFEMSQSIVIATRGLPNIRSAKKF